MLIVKCQMLNVNCRQRGFTLVEVIVYVAILSLVMLLISTFIFYMAKSNFQSKGSRESFDSAQRALEQITYEISGAKSVYTPTTTQNQLSLETSRYLPAGETTTYLDFFLCGTRLCLKKESQNPVFLTSDLVQIANISFTQISNNGAVSIKTSLTVSYAHQLNNTQPTITLTSTASLKKY